MASQVAHVVYAKKYLDRHPAMNADLFLLGTLFPDIRRVTNEVKRKDTHILHEDLDLEFEGVAPFEAGWKFHLWCDMRREEILNKYEFYKLSYTIDHDVPPKLLEDELVYEKYKNWEKLRLILNNPPEIKIGLDISQETNERWYAILAKYFEKKPDDKTMKAFLFKQRKLRGQAEELVDLVRKLRNNSKVVEILPKISEEILE
ncbi:MAG: hypothetical protein CO142_01410 [Candidatus Moranbacteria bacterium CG_4_9_14_3_um_filter_44_28]|nr:MAG: hypothetical protein COW51_04030 [Candidatus Moranbacteria bacterium CG17_big_fil_post_rev_8_21_14_2_50_44_12]PJA86200.1 MAG: hypothetical protein CO142_01410 [Candidatus Moranbacteria bacterium CG_4_9_14_3_um_filter_44_28]